MVRGMTANRFEQHPYPHPPLPERISFALNARQLYGPEVDAACLAAEPDVDNWEAGISTPSPEQVRALAQLTAYPVEWFYREPLKVVSSAIACGRSGRGCQTTRLLRDPFPPEGCPATVTV